MLDAFGSGPNRASWPGRSQFRELFAAADVHTRVASMRFGKGERESGLADARFAFERDDATAAGARCSQRVFQQCPRLVAFEKLGLNHGASLAENRPPQAARRPPRGCAEISSA